ncbi:MAG TPA: PilT/PilU family type 4a pilus ATPase [Phycisphaerae bacterium]|nr:PilT/PilU family type 4a pilus ATPase [Phycisphaerae bacterium]HPZ98970.1 PilT/PilU family type 4a pilus ATPase [Phycisphaerae bacterium]
MSTTVDPELLSLIETGLTKEASDLHLAVGHAPMLRIHGDLFPAADTNLTREATARMVASIVPTELRDKMASLKDFDFSLTLPRDDAPVRFRVNVFVSQGAIGACLRYVPSQIPSFEWMGIPQDLVRRIVSLHNGLVLITGVTGAGKTTTLAGLVEQLNQLGHRRIVTIEEPIEYLFEPKANSVITQREVGLDVASFADGLRSALRQDPDVILCGEVRDIETARMAISAAETGHLVMSTVHTQDAKGAITRLIDIFPAERQQDIRGQLALSLRIVVSQHLLPSITPGTKRALAMEILVANDAARAAIRLNKIEAIDTAIQTGKRWGMQTLDESLAYLACSRRITPETAYRYAKNPDGLRTLGVPVPPPDQL